MAIYNNGESVPLMPEPGVFAPLPDLWQIHREYEETVTPFMIYFCWIMYLF
jgi:hypothetical protein